MTTATIPQRPSALFLQPFGNNSLWNSRPVGITLDSRQIPEAENPGPWRWRAVVAGGPLATTAFLAQARGKAMTVQTGNKGAVSIPRWPAAVIPASGSDGHASIIDVTGNRVHSFWQLRQVNGQWQCSYYGWVTLGGSGWGDGARAAGVPCIAGVIRTHEVSSLMDAPDEPFPHALAMSLDNNTLASNPAWVPPASRADWDAAWDNRGWVPEGAVMMLPADFPVDSIRNPMLRRVARTLMTCGAFVVDKNSDTPFVVYVEGDYDLYRDNTDMAGTDADLVLMHHGLRMVTGVDRWISGSGRSFTPTDTALTPAKRSVK